MQYAIEMHDQMYLHKQLNQLTTARNGLSELYVRLFVYLIQLNAALELVAKCGWNHTVSSLDGLLEFVRILPEPLFSTLTLNGVASAVCLCVSALFYNYVNEFPNQNMPYEF